MRQMNFKDGTEFSYWGNVEFHTNEAAKAARDQLYKGLRRVLPREVRIVRSVLRDQLRPYSGLGQPDGTVGHAYKLRVVGWSVQVDEQNALVTAEKIGS